MTATATKPNLILITSDELRWDCLGCHSDGAVQTPNLDRLAARSVNFSQHFSNYPKCVPARISLMTGRYPHTDGYRTIYQHMRPGQDNLLKILREQGYQTALFGKNHCWDESDLAADIDCHADTPGYRELLDPLRTQPMPVDREGEYTGWDYIATDSRHAPDAVFVEQSLKFLRERDLARPCYLHLNMESPHPWYGVGEPWYSQYPRDNLPAWPRDLPEGVGVTWQSQRDARTPGLGEPLAAVSREIQATYYGMISELDARLGKLLDFLEAEGYFENSVIVFWSDHGDFAGQYGLTEKWDTIFSDCLMKVPFFLSAPGLPVGTVVDQLSDHSDIAPTLIELLNLRELPGMHGQSLLPLVVGDAASGAAYRPRTAVFAEGGHERGMRQRFNFKPHVHLDGTLASPSAKQDAYQRFPDSMARARMIRSKTHKLVIRETGENEFYCMDGDPFELENRYRDPSLASIRADLLEQLAVWCLQTDPDTPYQPYVGA
jgi:arylsulfatase A-like enzyme